MNDAPANETILAVIPGETPEARMVLVVKGSDEQRPMVLRQESFSEGVGWFAQGQIEMTRFEMSQLRSMLGGKMHRACARTKENIQSESEPIVLRLHPNSVSAAS